MRELMGEFCTDIKGSIADLSAKVDAIQAWKPELEARVSDLQEAVDALQKAAPTYQPHVVIDIPEGAGKAVANSKATTPMAPWRQASGPVGHDDPLQTRGQFQGTTPGVGQLQRPNLPPPSSPFPFTSPLLGSGSASSSVGGSHSHACPAMAFPQFDGENPRLWKGLCEQYFAMYGVDRSFWLPMATLNFSTTAAIWLQSVKRKVTGLDWEGFCEFLCSKFGRDQHQQLIRQFYHTKQVGSVAEYIEQFDALMNHLLSYLEVVHPLYFLTRFVEGLRDDIRAVVLIQRPVDLEAAGSLALLQEELTEGLRRDRPCRLESMPPRITKMTAVLPAATTLPRGGGLAGAEDRRALEAARPSQDADKVAALRAYRRAKGLCFTCGERGGGGDHRCLASVPLHVI
ncbi:uncharacterized protein [Aegilops tauschii subsp. strangulata]|uniref:uncharacterized protein n=1 Tax=Aegilops tauschii subsp. strangulata TaxID=200361 RepID=UPI003CC854E3